MKKIMNLFVLVAAAAMALASCQKPETEIPTPQETVYTFLIGNADETAGDDSKAAIGENSVVWAVNDEVGTFTDNSKNKYSKVTALDPATLSVYSYGGLSVGENIYFYYPYDANAGTDKTAVSMSIPAAQDGLDDMPLASLPFTVTDASTTNQTEYAGKIQFANLGAVIEFNVYSTNAAYQSEKVQSVKYEAGASIAGNFTFDLTAVNYSDKSTLAIEGYEETSVVSALSTPAAVPAAKEDAVKVNMVVAPGSYAGKVTVQTDKASYTFELKSEKEYLRSAVKPLGVNLANGVRKENPKDVWTLVASVDNMPDGDYVILAKHASASGYGYLPSTATSSAPAYEQQTVFDAVTSEVSPESVDAAMIWHFAKSDDKWTITNADGKYFYCINNNNGLRVGNTEDTWTISSNSYNNKAFTMQSTTRSRYVGVYNNQDWRSYTSATGTNYGNADNGYQNAQLFFYYHGTLEAKPAVNLSDVTGVSARGVEDAVLTFTLVNPDGSTVNVSCDGKVVTSASVEGETIVYSVAANETETAKAGTITVTYGEFEKTVNVSQKAAAFETTKLEIELGAEENASSSLTITSDFDWEAVSDGSGFTVLPETYVWEDDEEADGKQSVTVKATSANESEAGTAELGTITFTSSTGQKLTVTVKQKTSYVAPDVEGSVEESLKFSDLYSTNTSLDAVTVDADNFSIAFAKASGSSAPQYYTSGTSVRAYAKNTFTVSSDNTIVKIELTFGNSDGSNTITADGGVYNDDGIWTGSANSVTFTVGGSSGNRRISSITVHYLGSGEGGETPESGESTVVLTEGFDDSTTADSSSAISTSKFPNFSGATSKAYTSKYGGIKLGSGSAVGYITSKSLDLSSAFTVSIDACKYGSDTGNITVTVGSITETIDNSELDASGSFKTFVLTFDAATAASTVKIATSAKRAYIDNIVITRL